MILVGEVNYLLDTRLYNSLCALVAGEESDVNRRACEAFAAGVKDSVKLGVYNVLILCLACGFISVPGILVVRAALGEAVIAGGEDSFRTSWAGLPE